MPGFALKIIIFLLLVAEVQPKFFQPKLKFNEVLPSTELENWDDITMTAPSFSADIMLAKSNYMTYFHEKHYFISNLY